MTFDRRHVLSFDWLWFLALMLLSAAGAVAIASAMPGTGLESYFGRQVIYLALALVVFLVVLAMDYHVFCDFSTFLYLGGIGTLVAVLFFGSTINASKSWIRVAGVNLQPSELVKVLVIVAVAKYYSEIERPHLELRELLTGGALTAIPMILVVMQGDLGTAATYVPIFIGLSYLAGLKRKYVLVAILAVAVASPVGWMMLKDYQKGRIQTVFNPELDPKNAGYQTIQSEIAIGSGRFFGKGFGHGTQSQGGFLPARHTDFIFSVLAEETGFIGSICILGLFLFVSARLVRASREAKDRVGAFIVAGVLSLFLFHVAINLGMVAGFLPIVGIPLPLVSAGGSALISMFVAMALAMSVRMRRYVN